MAVERWTPATTGGVVQFTDGLYSISANWTPNNVPQAGDTAIITYGSLTNINQHIDSVTILAQSTAGQPSTALNFQDTVLGSATRLVVDSVVGSGTIALNISFTFENDGVIDFVGPAITLNALSATRVTNSGTINLRNNPTLLSIGGAVQNSGTITIANDGSTLISTSLSGTGQVVVAPGNRLEVSGQIASGQTIALRSNGSAGSTLQIDHPNTFNGKIAGFAVGDAITLQGVGAITSVAYTQTGAHSGTLFLSGSITSSAVNFSGDYTTSDFAISNRSGGATITTASTANLVANTDEVYRFFDTSNGTHFLTASVSERDTLLNMRSDLAYEGVGLTGVDSGTPAASPIYRFFDTRFGTHFYTASADEKNSVIATRSDLTYEGVGFSAHLSQQSGDAAVYRFFDTQFGTHFYTASATEAASIKASRADLSYEGVGFYAPST